MQRHFLSTGLWGNLPKVEGSNNQGGEDKAKDFRSILRWNSWMTRGTKPQNEYLSDQMGGKSQNINIKELLEQHVEHGKNHYGFLNRDLIFHPQRVTGRTRYRLLKKEKKRKTQSEQTIQLQPALNRQLPSENSPTNSPQVAQKKKQPSVNSWSHCVSHFPWVALRLQPHPVRFCVKG